MAFEYKINEEFGTELIGEGGNVFIAMRKIAWGNRDEKLDIRKYSINNDGNEVMMKGVSLSDDEANTLAEKLVERGYGDRKKILETIYKEDRIKILPFIIIKDEDFENEKELFTPDDILEDL